MAFPKDSRGLYAIVDPAQTRGRDPRDVAERILEAGPAVLQLRMKLGGDRAIVDLARDLRALCHRAGVPFVLNDRADLARLVDADGVHLGQDDLPTAAARAIVGSMPIGRSTHSLAQARAAEADGVDLIGFGPVYDTTTKLNPDPTVGVALLAEVVRSVGVPVVAIGGITPIRLREVEATGVAFVAAISAISLADDVGAASRAFVEGLAVR